MYFLDSCYIAKLFSQNSDYVQNFMTSYPVSLPKFSIFFFLSYLSKKNNYKGGSFSLLIWNEERVHDLKIEKGVAS